MENGISNEYIENAINELESFFGIKEPISGENIFSLIRNDKTKDAIKLIACQLNLPIDISITNVPIDYKSQNAANQFQSSHLVETNQDGARGSAGITAQVSIPSNLPSYGSSALNNYPINVKISKNCIENPAAFSMIMAHELSHVLLHSLNYIQKDNEFYTDLTAIMHGFQDIFQNGRKNTTREEIPGIMNTKVITTTTNYGYLSDEQFYFAHNKINQKLKKYQEREKLLLEELRKFNKLLTKYDETFLRFKNLIGYLTKNHNKKITEEDGKKIITFFQPNYINDLSLPRERYEQKNKNIAAFLNNLSYYSEQKTNLMSTYEKDLQDYTDELESNLISLEKDVKILSKYTNLIYKIKVFLSCI